MGNSILLDTNAILRYLLDDDHQKHNQVRKLIEENDCCCILPVIQEAVYVLEGFYKVPRSDLSSTFTDLCEIIETEDEDVRLKAFEYYTQSPKIDFTGCLLCAYRSVRNIGVFSFDEKLNRKLKSIGLPMKGEEE